MSYTIFRSTKLICTKPFRQKLNINYYSKVLNSFVYEINKSNPFKYLKSNLENNLSRHSQCSTIMYTKYSTEHKPCWNCESPEIYEYFCYKCKAIQPINKELNYFEILGLEKTFKINKKDLINKFRKLQSIFHPDKYSTKSENEQEFAAEHSSMLNKSYNIILHPVSRGEYILSLAGQPIEEGEMMMDPEFLMDIMDINERLADAEDKETVHSISRKNDSIMEILLREAENHFEDNNITAARSVVAKLKYYNNIYIKVKEYETKHGIFY